MKRPRLDSAAINTSSRATTILSGGDEAIIIGRLPTGQSGRRGIVLTTLPAASRFSISWFSFAISGRSVGFGTLLNHAAQLPEPGSWTSHRPDMSGSTGAVGARGRCALMAPTASMIATRAAPSAKVRDVRTDPESLVMTILASDLQ